MYNFLGLVNDINRSLNEVELDQNNFGSSIGFYNQAKNSVNFAIQALNQENFEWPFNHITNTLTLEPNKVEYDFPPEAKHINYDSFRVRYDPNISARTSKLFPLDYEEYVEKFSDMEYDWDRYTGPPNIVVRRPNLNFIIAPASSVAYQVDFESYNGPQYLENWDDVPSVPQAFRYVINEGSMSFAYRFRGDLEQAVFAEEKFKTAVKQMRSIYTNRTEYLRSTMR